MTLSHAVNRNKSAVYSTDDSRGEEETSTPTAIAQHKL